MTYLISGIVFGLSAGLSPGPLLTLVISETLKHGVREGVKVSIAPLLTDLPIIAVALLVLSRLSNAFAVLGVISLGGTVFLSYLGYKAVTFSGAGLDVGNLQPESLRKGVVANLLNPNPYVFWLTIGGPTVIKASADGVLSISLFVAAFYFLLVGSKIAVALAVERSRPFLKSKVYVYVNRGLGIVLFAFAALFVRDALKYFGVV